MHVSCESVVTGTKEWHPIAFDHGVVPGPLIGGGTVKLVTTVTIHILSALPLSGIHMAPSGYRPMRITRPTRVPGLSPRIACVGVSVAPSYWGHLWAQ